jgi:hypothetical protein
MNDDPVDLDKHRGMAAQKATDIRRVLADVEADAKLLRDRQGVVEIQLLAAPATSWPEAGTSLLEHRLDRLPERWALSVLMVSSCRLNGAHRIDQTCFQSHVLL